MISELGPVSNLRVFFWVEIDKQIHYFGFIKKPGPEAVLFLKIIILFRLHQQCYV